MTKTLSRDLKLVASALRAVRPPAHRTFALAQWNEDVTGIHSLLEPELGDQFLHQCGWYPKQPSPGGTR